MLTNNCETLETDVLVLGGGLAGCFAAITAKRAGAGRVMLADKSVPGKSGCSTFAAGVLAVFFPHKDNLEQWMTELVELGEFLNHQEWLQIVLESTYSLTEEMAAWGTRFLRTPDGDYERVLGRGGREDRGLRNIMFHGPQLMEPVIRQLRHAGVVVVSRTAAVDLLLDRGRVVGALGLDARTGTLKVMKARATILAAGATYLKGSHVGVKNQTGESHAMCYRAGADLMCFDYTSRNVSGYEFDTEGINMFQGLGGTYVNGEGEEFLHEYDPVLGNRTTKPRMGAAFSLEVAAGRGPIFLDMTHFGPKQVDKIRESLPIATRILERAGVMVGDRIVRKIQWGVAGPGSIAFGGGARIDTSCRSSNLEGLYVVGDAAAKLAAGAHEMGAGALTWAMVTGARAGQVVALDLSRLGPPEVDWSWVAERGGEALAPLSRKTGVDPEHIVIAVQETMYPYDVLEIRHQERLAAALERIRHLRRDLVPNMYAADPHQLLQAIEARSMAICAEFYLLSGMERKESRSNLREDYRFRDNLDWLKWVCLRRDGDDVHLWTEEIPKGWITPERDRVLHPFWTVAERRAARKREGAR